MPRSHIQHIIYPTVLHELYISSWVEPALMRYDLSDDDVDVEENKSPRPTKRLRNCGASHPGFIPAKLIFIMGLMTQVH